MSILSSIGPMQTQAGMGIANMRLQNAFQNSLVRMAQIENLQNKMFQEYMLEKEERMQERQRQKGTLENMLKSGIGAGTNIAGAAMMSKALSNMGGGSIPGANVAGLNGIRLGFGGGGGA